MITLDEHNALRRIPAHEALNSRPRRNGIECPRCKAELFDTNPAVLLTSCPPRKSIGCISCGYEGYRLA